ncbi:LAMI_0E11386g1_1 [Lachancea mirantina]|uniref:LAMI_0E11386g1_1 n=1 Tax=Lachancea mirantina TaxID=1230905 RepID=A0A1G4JPF5_9SACH|nr:LAMI_0E11386g1_1 [Lachancea mirantina]
MLQNSNNMGLPKFPEFLISTVSDQTKVMAVLFEESDSLIWFTLQNKKFMAHNWRSYLEFVEAVQKRLNGLCDEVECEGISSRGVDHLANIIAAHPRLGEPKKTLSIYSTSEQQSLQSSDSKETQEKLQFLNGQYEEKYEGLRFIVFVNGRSRAEIMKIMNARINSGNSWYEEARIAINEMCLVAKDRAQKFAPECQIHRM